MSSDFSHLAEALEYAGMAAPSIKPSKEAEALYVAAVGLCAHYDCPLDWLRIDAPIWSSENWMRFDGKQWLGGYQPTPTLMARAMDLVAWLHFPSLDDAQDKIGVKRFEVPIARMYGVKHKWVELWRTPEMDSFAALDKVDVPGGSYLAPDRFVGCEKCKIDQLEVTPRRDFVPARRSPFCFHELAAIPLPKAEPPLPLP